MWRHQRGVGIRLVCHRLNDVGFPVAVAADSDRSWSLTCRAVVGSQPMHPNFTASQAHDEGGAGQLTGAAYAPESTGCGRQRAGLACPAGRNVAYQQLASTEAVRPEAQPDATWVRALNISITALAPRFDQPSQPGIWQNSLPALQRRALVAHKLIATGQLDWVAEHPLLCTAGPSASLRADPCQRVQERATQVSFHF